MKHLTTTKEPTCENWVKITTDYLLRIPNTEGTGFSEEIPVTIDAWKNEDGEIFIPGDVGKKLEDMKARHMGLLTPEDIRHIRETLGLTQKEISEHLQIGEKSWTRWETGRERPSRSMNLLLKALFDGKIDLLYLKCMKDPVVSLKPIEPTRSHEKVRFALSPEQQAKDEMIIDA